MKKKNALTKAEEILKNEGVCLVKETDKFFYYICKGKSEQYYDVKYSKGKDVWICTCKNIRLVDCSHILACKFVNKMR